MFKDILTFLKNISFMDYIFFFTVVFLIILVVSLVYFIKINEETVEVKEDNTFKDPDNLKVITQALKKEEPKTIKLTSYEQEQEEKAIISYDELLSNTGEFKLNYLDDEKVINDNEVNVKKVDLNNLVNITQKSDIPKIEAHVISLEKEEEFLIALKQLLNNIK